MCWICGNDDGLDWCGHCGFKSTQKWYGEIEARGFVESSISDIARAINEGIESKLYIKRALSGCGPLREMIWESGNVKALCPAIMNDRPITICVVSSDKPTTSRPARWERLYKSAFLGLDTTNEG